MVVGMVVGVGMQLLQVVLVALLLLELESARTNSLFGEWILL
jgi:hypothetical protein